jgi:hypothetical protein
VAAHGTHAHIPTVHSNSIIYFTRYANCGEGTIEVTSLIYNTKYSALHPNEVATNAVNWVVVPWSGVRQSTLQDMIVTEPGDGAGTGEDVWKVMKPLQNFGKIPAKKISETAGYTIFTQSVKSTNMPDFEMPRKEVETDDDDNDDDDTGTCAFPATNSTTKDKACTATKPKETRRKEKRPVRIIAQKENSVSDTGKKLKDGRSILRMDLMPTVPSMDSHYDGHLIFHNGIAQKAILVECVIWWSNHGNVMLFVSNQGPEEINKKIGKGDEFRVFYMNHGKPEKDNLALSIVHGRDQRDKSKFKQQAIAR